MRIKLLSVAAILGAIMLGFACRVSEEGGSERPPAPRGLEDVDWILVEAQGMPAELPPEEGVTEARPPFVRFDSAENVLSGYAGCNSFHGGYRLDGRTLEIGPVGATRRACPEPWLGVEDRFLAALAEAKAFRVEGREMTLSESSEGRVVARFRVQ